MQQNLYVNQRLALTLLAIGIVVFVAYLPGLRGPFVFDDTYHILSNPAVALESLDLTSLSRAALSNDSGPLKRPLAMLSLALTHHFAGGATNTFPFKLTNLAIHLINTGLIYWLSLLLLRQLSSRSGYSPSRLHTWLPALVAATWALHPLQLTSVLYVVQRMTSLSALFVLVGTITFIYGRLRVQDNRVSGYLLMTVGLLTGLTLGLASKENAALLPLFILIIEYVFFHGRTRADRNRLKWFYSLAVFVPYTLALLWLLTHLDFILSAYVFRDFSISERLLTEPRILWFYTSLIFYPNIQRFGLFHDDIAVSTGLFQPWTTVVALAGLVVALTVAVVVVKRRPVLSFSILWFLAGHAMESSFLGLELAHEHRNYLSTFGPIFGIAYALARILERYRAITIPIGVFLLMLITLALTTYIRADIWRSEDSIAAQLVRNHPQSARAHLMFAQVHAQKRNPVKAINHYKRAAELAPLETGYLLRLALTVATTTVAQLKVPPQSNATTSKYPDLPAFLSVSQSNEGTRLELADSVLDEITKKLGSRPIHPRTAQGLAELAECARINRDQCGYIYPRLVEWYPLAIQNPRTFSGVRNDMIISLVETYLAYGDLIEALEMAKRARTIDPSNPNFVLMEADLYFRLGQLDKSERTLLSLDMAGLAITSSVKQQADILATQIASQRGQSTSR